MLHHTDLGRQLNEYLGAPGWYVGFSGGADSTVLLHLLHQWCASNPGAPPLHAIHINHGLQADAGDWQRHCQRVCESLGVPLTSIAVAVPATTSVEAAAREARYTAFESQLPPGAVLFLGHHLDDQVETFFLRLLRGAGVEGLAAMRRARPLGLAQLVRPLLGVERAAIEAYAARQQLRYVTDPSNSDTAMDRNFLRTTVLPPLADRWPAYRRMVARASELLADSSAALAEALGEPDCVVSRCGDPGLAPLLAGGDEVAATRLRAWLRAREVRAPDRAALVEFLRQLRVSAEDGNPLLVCGPHRLQRYRQGVYLLPQSQRLSPQEQAIVPGQTLVIPGVGAVGLAVAAGAGLALPQGGALTLRFRQGRERCQLPGRAGRRALKTLLQSWAIPPWWRDRVPLLCDGEEILAVGDLALCQSRYFRARPTAGEQRWNLVWQRPSGAVSD